MLHIQLNHQICWELVGKLFQNNTFRAIDSSSPKPQRLRFGFRFWLLAIKILWKVNAPLPAMFPQKGFSRFLGCIFLAGPGGVLTFLAELPTSGIATAFDPGIMIKSGLGTSMSSQTKSVVALERGPQKLLFLRPAGSFGLSLGSWLFFLFFLFLAKQKPKSR